jgi:RND family efflux transporter MFP subunit
MVHTLHSDRTELFVEFPALAVGHDSPFAVHLTDLVKGGPVGSGKVTVILSGNGVEESFEAGPSEVVGIFRPVARPSLPGQRELIVVHRTDGTEDRHKIGNVTVHQTAEKAIAAGAPELEEGGIRFLQEQQWLVNFATEPVARGVVRASFPAFGTVRPRPEAEAVISAPVSGRMFPAGDAFPRLGEAVAAGRVLAILLPRVSDADRASLELAAARARVGLEQTAADLQRLESLLAEGAVPERRVSEARLAERTARAEIAAARTRLAQHGDTTRAGPGTIEIKAPLAGVVTASVGAVGSFVEAGADLFRVVDPERAWLVIRVFEADAWRLAGVAGATFRIPGLPEVFEATEGTGAQVIGAGVTVDPGTRTIPLIIEFPNHETRIPVGTRVIASVLTGQAEDSLVLPAEAVQEDGGLDVAYVQVTGESFDRRVLRLGVRDGARIQVLDGLVEGERVVARGAWYVRLASAAGSIPAHGHAH